MKERFRSIRFTKASLERIKRCDQIIGQYQGMGLRLTLRQLFYQLVTSNAVTNTEKSYKALSGLVTDARLAGLLDWSAIEDRVRVPRVPQEFKDLAELIEVATRSYRLPRWDDQSRHVELWVEKDALAGVLAPIASRFHITLMVNRGYSSASAMYESARRFDEFAQSGWLLYLGDHDPSGEDMVRDIRSRLELFGADVTVKKVALTMEQIEEYEPPPNPAKVTDPRAEAYIRKHGDQSWEVDALPPNVLTRIVTEEIEALVDAKKMAAVIKRENADKKILGKLTL